MARIARWNRPIEGFSGRLRAWSHMLLADHGVFRLLYLNRHQVTEKFWRSAQPAPHDFLQLKQAGIRTIVNLRGGREHGSWQLEKEACARLGLTLREFVVRSRGAPDRHTILEAKSFFESLEYPALFHCKSGADRAGFVAALFLILQENKSVSESLRQLSSRYGHFRFAKTGILDSFFERYRDEGESMGVPFLSWVETTYDPEALEQDFRPGLISDLLVDKLIRRE